MMANIFIFMAWIFVTFIIWIVNEKSVGYMGLCSMFPEGYRFGWALTAFLSKVLLVLSGAVFMEFVLK